MKLNLSFVLIGVTVNLILGGEMIERGEPAPDFQLKDSKGNQHRLSDYRGRTVVLFFYPKDGTPGCTAEACNLRDHYAELTERGIAVLGISYDDSASHREFADKNNLPFPLLSDTEKRVSEKYGAKSGLLGYFFPKRITYIISPDGVIIDRIEKVKTDQHAAQILQRLEQVGVNPNHI